MGEDPKYDKTKVSEGLLKDSLALAGEPDDNFLELSKALYELQLTDVSLVKDFAEKSGLSKRKVYYYIDIGKAFEKIPVKSERLRGIGWTKLKIVASHVTKQNWKELLTLAEKYTARDLELVIRGEPPMGDDARVILMYLSPEDFEIIAEALAKFGGLRVERGVNGKEQALVRMSKYILEDAASEHTTIPKN